jgi:hypothetical protein
MVFLDFEIQDWGLFISTDWIYLEFNWLSIATTFVLFIGYKLWRRSRG